MAITGTHTLLYTSEPDRLRAMLRDVFGFKYVDTGHDWLIFALPPSEIAVHPGEGPTFDSGVRHQFSLMCDRLDDTVRELRAKGVEILGEKKEERWGIFVTLNLPGNCHVILYEPKHGDRRRNGVIAREQPIGLTYMTGHLSWSYESNCHRIQGEMSSADRPRARSR